MSQSQAQSQSQSQSASLLWINKDASNLHRKKHLAEVNAHVQRGGGKRKQTKRPIGRAKHKVSNRTAKLEQEQEQDESQYASGSNLSKSSTSRSQTPDSDSSSAPERTQGSDAAQQPVSLPVRSGGSALVSRKSGLIFSHYSDDDAQKRSKDSSVDGSLVLPVEYEFHKRSNRLKFSLSTSLDPSNPLPGLLTDLSSRDKMLVHTHLTYMPQLYFGLSKLAVYCPIRTSSVANMARDPITTLWVLISLEMFLETVQGGNAHRNTILRRKTQAYRIMSKTFSESTDPSDEILLIAPVSAAIAELFCGDPARALTHLNGIEAVLKARGGLDYVRKMDVAASMPIYAVFAYRTLLQDNLPTYESFDRARSAFVGNIKSFVQWNQALLQAMTSMSNPSPSTSPLGQGPESEPNIAKDAQYFNQARIRAFATNRLVRKFVVADFAYSRPGEKIDQFLVLYNLNLALLDYGTAFQQAAQFLEDFIRDVELGGSTSDEDSSINASGVLRLLTNRQIKKHVHLPGAGVARVWEALDALEIMKLLSVEQQQNVRLTLHSLLVGQLHCVMTEEDLAIIDSTAIAEWLLRHPGQ